MVILSNDDSGPILTHYGILRKSGRYPWGSGGNVPERSRSFIDHIKDLKNKGLTEATIASGFDMSTTDLRALKSIANAEVRQANISMAQRLKDKGYSNVAIGEHMGLNESSVRSLLSPGIKDKTDRIESTANILKSQVNGNTYLDIGTGVEQHMGITRTQLDIAVSRLKQEGYEVHTIQVPQVGSTTKTSVKVLAPAGTTYRDIVSNKDRIKPAVVWSDDNGRTYQQVRPPLSVSSKRLQIKYAEDGGSKADGVVYIRGDAPDLSLGGAQYAQVRISIDKTHYIKGMAIVRHDLPDGVDMIFNTNKSDTGNKHDALKKLSDDVDLPFGATIRRQILSKDGTRAVSAVNIVNEQGSWDTWANTLSSQFLSKQAPVLAREQLGLVVSRKNAEFDEIRSLTNPVVKRNLLIKFADETDSAAVSLKAAALPRQASRVILPLTTISNKEVYAPGLRNGEIVVLVRHPHGGIFEIPELKVNNRNPEAKRLLGNAPDAIGIHHSVAARLSGADFDGDTVLVIPNNHRKVKTSPALKGLASFDPIAAYPGYEGMTRMTSRGKAFAMGDVSNLITDMTIRGAPQEELIRAVRHSMVVIDAEKHGLNYKQSAIDNGIPQLKEKYQGSPTAGARTLISRASSRIEVPVRKPWPASKGGPIDSATGRKVFVETGETWVNSKNKIVVRTQASTKLAETDNAHTLASGTKIEAIYADHANALKSLANKARLAAVQTTNMQWSPSAKRAYTNEVASLKAKLNVALRNAPKERHAQLIANTVISAKRQSNPGMTSEELKKVQTAAINASRARTGAGKERISITQLEWDAIQAGAISSTLLEQILMHADNDQVRALATPKATTLMTPIKLSRAHAMLKAGYTQAEVADALGMSVTTLKAGIKDGPGAL